MPFFATLAANCARGKGILLPPVGFVFYENVTTSVNNYNVRTKALAAGWNGTSILDAVVQVSSEVAIGSTSSATPAFDTGVLSANSFVTLLNNGYVVGFGGSGGAGAGNSGTNGGLAVNFQSKGIVINNFIVGGGGGGGGGGGNYVSGATSFLGGSGGGGGAGRIAGNGGAGATGSILSGFAGNVGLLTSGGTGGPSVQTLAPIISLQSGTEFTSNAVYQSSAGATTFWWSITADNVVTSQGQGLTKAWVTGQKLFATATNDQNGARSNFVGEYAFIATYTGAVNTYTVPGTVPGTTGFISPTTVFAELYGGGSWGGYTRINLATTSQQYFYCVGSNGGDAYTGFAGQTRFRWDRFNCNNNQDQRGAGWTGLFNAHPYGGTTNYTDTATIIANSGIYGIAGGGTASNAAGGGTTGGGRGGTQTAPGGSHIENVNNGCASQCPNSGTSENVFSVCPSRLIGQWVAGGFETCTYGSGSGGYFPGGSWTTGGCGGTNAGGGSGYVGSIAGSGSFTQNGTNSNPTDSPYFVTSSRLVIRIR